MLNNLPKVLLPYQDKILATVKPVINITLKPAKDLPLWASKVGGKPYLPKDFEYPISSNGIPLKLLAQINLSDVPSNDFLPKTGILSFFIEPALGKYSYGQDHKNLNNQDGFRVFYFEDICDDNNQLMTDFSEFESHWLHDDTYSPLSNDNQNFAMSFDLDTEIISACDYHSAEHFFGINDYYQIYNVKGDDKKLLRFLQKIDNSGHKLLGYPFFTQMDPRFENVQFKDYILLFQLDSDEDYHIMWGDCGVGNFFIHPDDLKNLDFSKVVYYWDCT